MDDGPGRCLSGVMEGAAVAVGTTVAAAVAVGAGVATGAQAARKSNENNIVTIGLFFTASILPAKVNGHIALERVHSTPAWHETQYQKE